MLGPLGGGATPRTKSVSNPIIALQVSVACKLHPCQRDYMEGYSLDWKGVYDGTPEVCKPRLPATHNQRYTRVIVKVCAVRCEPGVSCPIYIAPLIPLQDVEWRRNFPDFVKQAQKCTSAAGFTVEDLRLAEARVLEEVQRSMRAPIHRTLMRVHGALAVDVQRCRRYRDLDSSAPRQLIVGMVASMASYGSLYELLRCACIYAWAGLLGLPAGPSNPRCM